MISIRKITISASISDRPTVCINKQSPSAFRRAMRTVLSGSVCVGAVSPHSRKRKHAFVTSAKPSPSSSLSSSSIEKCYERSTLTRKTSNSSNRTKSSKLLIKAQDAKTPQETFETALATSEKKAKMLPRQTFALGITAGALIGLGGLLLTQVGAQSASLAQTNAGLCSFLKGAIGLPFGLSMVILTGAELFTGNVFVMISGVLEKRVTKEQLIKNWVISYGANFVGSVFMAYMAYFAMTSAANPQPAIQIAQMKASLPFAVAFTRGVLCNWLVCLAVWGTMATTSVAGKLLAIFWPISAFVAMGFEHSIANMFLIPHGMLYGANVSIAQMMFGNILPVTLGNTVGAAVFVAGVHYIAYGTHKK